jgi:mannosyltransferase
MRNMVLLVLKNSSQLKTLLLKYFPVLLLSVNLILKFLFISSNDIAGDEPFSIYHSQMDVNSILDLMKVENNPPLHFLLLHFWIKIFGISVFSVRFLSVIFSSLTAMVIYQIGKKFFSFRIAFLSSVLFSFSNLNLLLAHEARVYTLFGLLAALSMYLFLYICNDRNNYKYLILLLITNALILYAHYLGFFVIIIQTIAVILIKDVRRKIIKVYSVYFFLIICSYIPNILVFISRFTVFSNGHWVAKPYGISSIYEMLWSFSNQPVSTVFCILLLLTAIVKLIIMRKQVIISQSHKIVMIWFLFPFISIFITSLWLSIFLDRYLIFISSAYYIIIAIAISYILPSSKYKHVLSILFIFLFLFTFNPNKSNKSHAKEMTAKVIELKDNNTLVFICHSYFILNFAYYYSKDIFCEVDNGNHYEILSKRLHEQNIYPINSAKYLSYSKPKIIYVDAAANSGFPNNNILNTLIMSCKLKTKYFYDEQHNVYEFERLPNE